MRSEPAWLARPRPAKDRGFIGDEPLRRATVNDKQGVQLKVRLTSYRSLPLSCIEAIELKIDGERIDPDGLVLTLDSAQYRLRDLPKLSKVYWFILDHADLFAPLSKALTAGAHEVEGTLVTVEPYMTAGRFSFHNSARKTLPLEAAVERA